MNLTSEKALVVLSGGQDSTTCLYWAIYRFGRDQVETVTFDYGQKHRIELECAERICAAAGVPFKLLPIDTFQALGGNALVDASMSVSGAGNVSADLPDTFVPGRNLVFLPTFSHFGVSRRIADDGERKRLRTLLGEVAHRLSW